MPRGRVGEVGASPALEKELPEMRVGASAQTNNAQLLSVLSCWALCYLAALGLLAGSRLRALKKRQSLSGLA
jgi:hypothetical protein